MFAAIYRVPSEAGIAQGSLTQSLRPPAGDSHLPHLADEGMRALRASVTCLTGRAGSRRPAQAWPLYRWRLEIQRGALPRPLGHGSRGGLGPDPSLPFCDFSHQGSNLHSACVGDVDNNNNSDSRDLSLRLTEHGLRVSQPPGNFSSTVSRVSWRWRRERQAVGSGETAYPLPSSLAHSHRGRGRAWRAAPGAGGEACAPSSQASDHPHLWTPFPLLPFRGKQGALGA